MRMLIGAVALVVLALGVAGCAQAGKPILKSQAAKLTAGTGEIATACGDALQATAFAHQHPRIGRLESMAHMGAIEIAAVFKHDHDQNDIYFGDTVEAIVHQSITLLSQCGLQRAGAPLRAALAARSK